MPERVAILHDQLSPDARADEVDVLAQIEPIERLLGSWGTITRRIGCTLDLGALKRAIDDFRPDWCFNFVESLDGRGSLVHLVPAALEGWGVRFTGSGSIAMHLASNKLLAKERMSRQFIPTPDWRTLDDLDRPKPDVPPAGRWIIKSVWEHASLGLDEDNVVEVDGSLADATRLCHELKRRLVSLGGAGFVERYIEGREFNVSILNGEVLPIAEMTFEGYAAGRPRVVGYRAKWDESSPEYHQTTRRFTFGPEDDALLKRIDGLTRECWATFGLRGWARVDYRVDEEGRPFVLEVNANPCLAPDAGFMAAAQIAGRDLEDVLESLSC